MKNNEDLAFWQGMANGLFAAVIFWAVLTYFMF
jgi:hypothetical protein